MFLILVAFPGRRKLARITPVRTERDEPAGLFAPLPAQNLLHCRTEVVISKLVEYPVVIRERQFVRLQKCLLGGMDICKEMGMTDPQFRVVLFRAKERFRRAYSTEMKRSASEEH